MRRQLLFAGVVLLAVLGGFFGYWYWQTQQPRYALTQVVKACQTRDIALFRRYVSEDAVVAHAVDQLMNAALPADQLPSQDGVRQFLQSLGSGLAQVVKTNLAREVRGKVENAVTTGKLEHLRLSDTPVGDQGADGPATLFIGPETRTATQAEIPVICAPGQGKPVFTLQIVLRRQDQVWRVVAIENLKDILPLLPSLLLP